MAERPQYVFVTGTPRSGTTLTDKLLWQFPDVDSFSQPLPLVLSELKREFLHSINHPRSADRYSLTDKQFVHAYRTEQFIEFLNNAYISSEFISAIIHDMKTFSGQYFKGDDPFGILDIWKGGGFKEFYHTFFMINRRKKGANFVSWKETFSEEFIPFFLRNGERVILMVRDPRDLVCSLNYGNHQRHSGSRRPLLWIARQWRKTAACALAFRDNPHVSICRFEELTAQPNRTLTNWKSFLGTDAEPQWQPGQPLIDQTGAVWKANSSFEEVSDVTTRGIGRYRNTLPPQDIRFIEALCYPEMVAMGYSSISRINDLPQLLESIPDEAEPERPDLAYYRWAAERRAEELHRLDSLADTNGYREEAFLFRAGFDEIRRALSNVQS